MPLDKPLESITEADLQSLLDDGIAEGKLIDYKESLPDGTDEAKKEFLADVSSFANASGGHLVFGIREDRGVPVEILGLPGIDTDAEILRLENMIRDSIDPRIPGILARTVALSGPGPAVVMRIPRSWQQPHVVTYRRHWRFYSRNSAGKYPLDVSEVRAAFALSESLAERIRLFRTERLAKLIAGQAPVETGPGAKIVLHIIPFGAFDPTSTVDIRSLGRAISALLPIGAAAAAHRYNLDGILAHEYSHLFPGASYAQLFHGGIIESVETSILRLRSGDTRAIPSVAYEKALLDALPAYLSLQERIGATPPLFIMLSLLGVCGFVMAVAAPLDPFGDFRHAVDRDVVMVPEALVDSFRTEPAVFMRPVFDSVWNSAGWPRSMNYDDSGRWCQGPNCRPRR